MAKRLWLYDGKYVERHTGKIRSVRKEVLTGTVWWRFEVTDSAQHFLSIILSVNQAARS